MNKENKYLLLPLFLAVIANYIAQIPYGIHLYHGHFNPVGVSMLLVTLVWFLAGYVLLLMKKRIGYVLLLSFLIAQVLFYFHSEILLAFWGYGILYHLGREKDIVLWWVFFIGDINFFVASFYLYYLLKYNSLFLPAYKVKNKK